MDMSAKHTPGPTIPSRRDILADFSKWTKSGSDPLFQFERAVRRWINCGYGAMEIPEVLTGFSPEQFRAAIAKATPNQ
jgi:hypothetical protein